MSSPIKEPMCCPTCSCKKSSVIETRGIYRRRMCVKCNTRWSTVELRIDDYHALYVPERLTQLQGYCKDLGNLARRILATLAEEDGK